MKTHSTFQLWADYPGRPGVKVSTSADSAHLESVADDLLSGCFIDHWYIIEKRTEVTFHIHRVMGD